MNENSRLLVALGASLAIFYVWYTWIAPTPDPAQVEPASVQAESTPESAKNMPATIAAQPAATAIVPTQPQVAQQDISIDTGYATVRLSNDGGVPVAWTLRDYLRDTEDGTEAIDLVTAAPLQVRVEGIPEFPALPRYRVEKVDATTIDFVWANERFELRKRYAFRPQSYVADVSVVMRNLSSAPLQTTLGLGWEAKNQGESSSGFFAMLNPPADVWKPLYSKDNSVERLDDQDELLDSVQQSGSIAWAGLENRYFLGAILPRESQRHQMVATLTGESLDNGVLSTMLQTGAVVIPAQSVVQKDFIVYAGPKEISDLTAASASLEGAIDYGFVSVVAMPILHMLKFFYGLIHNYGIAIVLLTLVIKALLHPITKKSMESMKRMQALQPQIKALKERCGDDKDKLNQEMMQLFRSQKVNPMGGCLPMLLQLPVYFALYRVLWNSIELYRAPFVGYITDLSAPDPYYITPILLGVAFFLQQKLTPTPTADPAQKNMMMMMSLMFPLFMAFLPSGLVIYILINTLFTVLQQWLMNRGLGFRDLLRGRIAAKS